MKAADISDKQIVSAVSYCIRNGYSRATTALRSDIQDIFQEFPHKVVNSKLRQATLKGLLLGCMDSACVSPASCRGDYSLTKKGRELLYKEV